MQSSLAKCLAHASIFRYQEPGTTKTRFTTGDSLESLPPILMWAPEQFSTGQFNLT